MPLCDLNAWKILGVDVGSKYEDIRKAFLKKALEFHPDKKNVVLQTSSSNEEFQSILTAFEKLKRLCSDGDNLKDVILSRFGNANEVKLSATEQIDVDLYCYTCHCGYELPIEFNQTHQSTESVLTDCGGCSAIYRIELRD